MARGPIRKLPVQTEDTIFALDIGTRSIIGMVGVVEEGRVKIIAVEREEHSERAMIDGQIENIGRVSALADKIKKRLEDKIQFRLDRVCVAAAGRALRTKRADFELDLPTTQIIDDETISRLEAGAISKAEEAFEAENLAEEDTRRFYLVGYTVCQYYLDRYMISSLKDHRGKQIKVDLIATFLPSEVVESLYMTMNKIGLEVASITLEPIAAINAAIPANLRLLNLVMVDIGAGTSDIAACTDGSVTGYTMATVAGDEITETIMKEYLVDFKTAESMKIQIRQKDEIPFTDILGFERTVTREELLQCIQGTSELLCREIAAKILEINGSAPSALFLAGGGSKLAGLKEGLTVALQMDEKRVAIAGNNFQTSAFSEEFDLNNPEYATPLGIAISSGLNLINDGFRVILNDRPAKLFRSGSFTALNLLMMNGYSFLDIMGRTGFNLAVTVNGRRKVFYGTASEPASLLINKKEGKLSEVIHAGDVIDFTPAIQGVNASACLGDIDGADICSEILLNGSPAPLKTPLKNGDIITIRFPEKTEEDTEVSGKEASIDTDNADNTGDNADIAEPQIKNEETNTVTRSAPTETSGAEYQQMSFSPSEITGRAPAPAAAYEAPVRQAETPAAAGMPVRPAETPAAAGVSVRPAETSAAAGMPVRLAETPAAAGSPALQPHAETVDLKNPLLFHLNDASIRLPRKSDGSPYYLMDMIQYSGIDLKHPKGRITLTVNGAPGMFQQALREGDIIQIEEEEPAL